MDLLEALTTAALLTSADREDDPPARSALQGALRGVREAIGNVDASRATRHKEGATHASKIPWVAIFPTGEPENDPKRGYYAAYLFAEDGSYVNLCLIVGTTDVGKAGAVLARSQALRSSIVAPSGAVSEPELASTHSTALSYSAATAFAKPYDLATMPSDAELKDDLKNFVTALDVAYASGLRFGAKEPIHVFYPWLEEAHGPGIVNARRAIAETEGASWWVTNTLVADEKVAAFNDQVASGLTTYAYLYANGDSWRTRILQVTKSVSVVESEPHLLADGYAASEGRLAMKLAEFEAMPTNWRGDGLLGMRGQAIEDSVSARPAFSYVYTARPEDHKGSAVPRQIASARVPDTAVTPDPIDIDSELDQLAKDSGLSRDLLSELLGVLNSDMPHLVLAGPPGTGKTWLGKRLSDLGQRGPGPSYSLVQFHPSYAYEDFIEGLRPVVKDKQVVFENEPGHLLRLVNKLPDGGPNTLIIDELNRASIPSVFGELLYLLEYRNEAASLRLSGDFQLPPEVRFIATMNTADRSIRSMDAALRRRFEVFELSPSPEVLQNFYTVHGTNEVPDLVDGFRALNGQLTDAIDRHHGIGHSFFMRKVMTPAALRAAWLRKVRPLIEEFFFDEPHRVDKEFVFTELWPSQLP